ncbi:unnamed protein product [Bemisia tabaci]|uniref:PHD-type domain-containing protein n=1 Tax=Bemisia tabaci TaxID=7038 RepID=A0A9P0G0U7_BEMTA|nr:unnamed protein product [Bemisia tabaci]
MMEGWRPACEGCGYPVDLEVDLQCRRCGSFAHFECAEVAPETDIRSAGLRPDEDYNCSVCRSENQSMDRLRSGHGRQLSQTRQGTSNTSHTPSQIPNRSPSRTRHGMRQARQSHSTSPAGRKRSHASRSASLAGQESRRASNERSGYNASLTRYNTISNKQPGGYGKTSGKRVTIRESEDIQNRRNYDFMEDEGIPIQMNQQQASGQFPIRQGIISQPSSREPYETFPCDDPNDTWNHLSSFATQEPRICHRPAFRSTNQPPAGCSMQGHWASTLPHHVDQQQIYPGVPRQNYLGIPQQCHLGVTQQCHFVGPQLNYPGVSQQCYLGAQTPGRPLENVEFRPNCPMQIAGVNRFDPLQTTCPCEGSRASQPRIHSQPRCTDQRGAENWSTRAEYGSVCREFKARSETTKPPHRDADIGNKETGKNSSRMADNHYQDGIRPLRSGFSPGTQSPRVDESQVRGETHEPEADIDRAYSDQRRRSWSTSDDVSRNQGKHQVRENTGTYSSGPPIPTEGYETEPDSQQRCFEPLLTSTRIGHRHRESRNPNTNGFPLQNEGFTPRVYVDRSYSELPTGPRKTSNSAMVANRNQFTSNVDRPGKEGDSASARHRKTKTDPCETFQFQKEPDPNLIRGGSSCGLGMRPSRSFYTEIGPTSTPNPSGLGPSQLDYGGMGLCQPVPTEMGPPTPNCSGMLPQEIGTVQASYADMEFSVVGPSESFYLGLRTPQPVCSDGQNCCADNLSGVPHTGPAGGHVSNEDQPQETRSKMEICEDLTNEAIETLSKLKKASSKVASEDIQEGPDCSEVHSVGSVGSIGSAGDDWCTERDWMAKQARTYRQLDEIAAKIAAMEKKHEHLLDDSGEKSTVRRQRSVHFASDCDVDENLKQISVKLDTMENNQVTLSSSWLQQLKGFKAYTEAVQMRLSNLEQRTRMLEEKAQDANHQTIHRAIQGRAGGSRTASVGDLASFQDPAPVSSHSLCSSVQGQIENSVQGKNGDSAQGQIKNSAQGQIDDSIQGQIEDSIQGQYEDSIQGQIVDSANDCIKGEGGSIALSLEVLIEEFKCLEEVRQNLLRQARDRREFQSDPAMQEYLDTLSQFDAGLVEMRKLFKDVTWLVRADIGQVAQEREKAQNIAAQLKHLLEELEVSRSRAVKAVQRVPDKLFEDNQCQVLLGSFEVSSEKSSKIARKMLDESSATGSRDLLDII